MFPFPSENAVARNASFPSVSAKLPEFCPMSWLVENVTPAKFLGEEDIRGEKQKSRRCRRFILSYIFF